MSTSRTGTARWKRNRQRVLREAQAQGLASCPHCGTRLDYGQGRTPSSAEVDHTTPWAAGGADDLENLTVLCRHCNQSKGQRVAPKAARRGMAKPLVTSRQWFE